MSGRDRDDSWIYTGRGVWCRSGPNSDVQAQIAPDDHGEEDGPPTDIDRHPDDFSGDFGEDLVEHDDRTEETPSDVRRGRLDWRTGQWGESYGDGEGDATDPGVVDDRPRGRLPTWPRWRVALSIWLHPFRTADTIAAALSNMNDTHDIALRASGGDIFSCPITTDQGLSQAWGFLDRALVGMRAIDWGPWWHFRHRQRADMWRELTHPGEPALEREEGDDDIPF